MRFRVAFETEDYSSRISCWFMGTVSSVQIADPIRWPNSPWRLLQVTWDEEPDLLQNAKSVMPWLVELVVSNMSSVHVAPPFSLPKKKPCTIQHPNSPPSEGQLPSTLVFPENPIGPSESLFCCSPDTTSAGIQGVRHDAQFGLPLPDVHLNNLQSGLPPRIHWLDHHTAPPSQLSSSVIVANPVIQDNNASHLQTTGDDSERMNKPSNEKPRQLVLFGKRILTSEQQMPLSNSIDTVSTHGAIVANSSSHEKLEKPNNISDDSASAHNGRTKQFMS